MGLTYIKQKLQYCSDANYHTIRVNNNFDCTFIYIESIVQQNKLKRYLFAPLIRQKNIDKEQLIKQISAGIFFPTTTRSINDLDQMILAILEGNVALYIEGENTHFVFPLIEYQNRSVDTAQNEMVISGPHAAFIEDLKTNLSLLRQRIRHSNLKIIKYRIGKYTRTSICILYIEGLCEPDIVQKIKTKIKKIHSDSILGASQIAEYLEERPYSPFPKIQFTERPDTLAASVMEGRIGIMVEGTPISLILPVNFFSLMQSAEDYYQRFIAATWIRWIRYLFLLTSFLFPSLYVAITTFHPEMIPANLLSIIAAARENIPFPTLVEALMMEITFEGLREAGIRIPKPIGQTISIIGAIVIGQAAVQAGFVSAPMVIVVSITGIASFVTPHFELGLTFRLLRFPIMILGGTFGLFGVIIGLFLIFCHLVSLESYGKPYMVPFAPIRWSQWKDIFYRSRWDDIDEYKTSLKHQQRSSK